MVISVYAPQYSPALVHNSIAFSVRATVSVAPKLFLSASIPLTSGYPLP
jgi:hypothetical protein